MTSFHSQTRKPNRSGLSRLQSAVPDESGQGLSEYLILVLLVAIVSITAARTFGGTLKKKLQLAERHLEKVSVE